MNIQRCLKRLNQITPFLFIFFAILFIFIYKDNLYTLNVKYALLSLIFCLLAVLTSGYKSFIIIRHLYKIKIKYNNFLLLTSKCNLLNLFLPYSGYLYRGVMLNKLFNFRGKEYGFLLLLNIVTSIIIHIIMILLITNIFIGFSFFATSVLILIFFFKKMHLSVEVGVIFFGYLTLVFINIFFDLATFIFMVKSVSINLKYGDLFLGYFILYGLSIIRITPSNFFIQEFFLGLYANYIGFGNYLGVIISILSRLANFISNIFIIIFINLFKFFKLKKIND